jgi:hypothetical protein
VDTAVAALEATLLNNLGTDGFTLKLSGFGKCDLSPLMPSSPLHSGQATKWRASDRTCSECNAEVSLGTDNRQQRSRLLSERPSRRQWRIGRRAGEAQVPMERKER